MCLLFKCDRDVFIPCSFTQHRLGGVIGYDTKCAVDGVSRTARRYYMYGYLIPALIIIVTNSVALAVDQYAYVRDEL